MPRGGSYRYRARTASTAFRAKRAPSPTSKAGRRQARAAARRAGKLPAPGTKSADRMMARFTPDTEEARFYQRAARDFELSGGSGANPYLADLRQLQRDAYRRAYNAQRPHRRATAPKRRKSRVRVRAHWRSLPA